MTHTDPISLSGPAGVTQPAAPPPAPATPATGAEADARLGAVAEVQALPFVAAELVKIASSAGATTQDVVNTLRCDPAIAARVLRLANSSFYRVKERIATLERAVICLGFSGVRNAVLALTLLDDLFAAPDAGAATLGLWQHSLACGLLTRALLADGPTEEAEQGFVAGLLHDLGRVVLRRSFPDAYAEVAEAAANGAPLCAAESRRVLVEHPEVARRLLTEWKIPAEIVEPILLHHESWTRLRARKTAHLRVATALWLAERVLKTQRLGAADDDRVEPVPDEAAQVLGLKAPALSALVRSVHPELEELGSVIHLHLPEGAAPPRLAADPPPEAPARKAVWVRTVEPRVDLVSLLLERLDHRVEAVAAPARVVEREPDLVLFPAESTRELEERLEQAREALRMMPLRSTRCILLAPAALLAGQAAPHEHVDLVGTPVRARELEALLGHGA